VPVAVFPPVNDVGDSDTDEGVTGATMVNIAPAELLAASVATIYATPLAAPVVVLIVKEPWSDRLLIVTELGTVTALLSLFRVTDAPVKVVRATTPVELDPATTVDGVNVNTTFFEGLTASIADWLPPSRDEVAVIVTAVAASTADVVAENVAVV